MSKKSFILYAENYEPIKDLTDEQMGRLFRALFCERLDLQLPQMDGMTTMAFRFLQDGIQRADARYEEISQKRREAVQKRYSSTKPTNATNVHTSNGEDRIGKDRIGEDRIGKGVIGGKVAPAQPSAPTPSRFQKPTISEVAAYAAELRYAGFNAEAFCAYYESNGWKVGKNPMKSWKNAVTSWYWRDQEKAKPSADYKSRIQVPDRNIFQYEQDQL